MTRQRRDPAEKAQEALNIARRKVLKLRAKRHALETEARDLAAEEEVATAEATYLAQNPHLKQKPEPTA